jgi:hypothetical protein
MRVMPFPIKHINEAVIGCILLNDNNKPQIISSSFFISTRLSVQQPILLVQQKIVTLDRI